MGHRNLGLLFWFRALIPNWRFFDYAEEEALLLYRMQRAGTDRWGEWRDALPPPARRGPLTLFHNPEGTLRLALNTLVERTLEGVDDGGVNEELIANWVRRLTEGAHVKNKFQFKIVVRDAAGHEEERIVSAVLD